MEAKKTKIFCAVPTTGTITDTQSYFWRTAEKKYADRLEFVWPEACVRRIFHDFARNSLVEEFLKTDCDILFFLDSDVCPPDDIFDIVTEDGDKWQAAGAPYPVFMPANQESDRRPVVLFTAYKKNAAGGLAATNVPMSGKEYIDGLATGCLFLKRHLLEQMSRPWFAFEYDDTTRCVKAGEDLSFCRKVSDLGYNFFVDYSKVCRHYKTVCLLEVNAYAMEYAKRTLQRYVEQLETNMLAAMQEKQRKSKLVSPTQALIQKFRT